MRPGPFFARLVIASGFALLASFAGAQRALADPCTIDISFVRAVPNSHDYAIEFASMVDGVAELRWTMYATERTYVTRLAATTFTAPIPPSPRHIHRWHSAPLYVRVPDDAPAPTAATVELVDPITKTPIACSGGRTRFGADAGYVPDPVAESDPAVRAIRAEERRALDGAAAATPIVLDGTAAAPLTCAEPYRNASVTKAFQASYPPAAENARAAGTTFVLVEIAPTNDVTQAFVVGTSSSRDLDDAARTAAQRSTYLAERFRCEPVAGVYLFQVDFTVR